MEIDLFEITNNNLDNAQGHDEVAKLPKEIPGEIRGNLCNFLKDNDAFEKYIKNFDTRFWKQYTSRERAARIMYCIDDAFSWGAAPEDMDFWGNLYEKAKDLEA